MSQANFHIYVISKGQSGLYRSLLSIWNLEEAPELVTIICPEGLTGLIHRSVYTVSDDTGRVGPRIVVRETKSSSWHTVVVDDTSQAIFKNTGFLIERDMFIPGYSKFFSLSQSPVHDTLLSYYQRLKFGNSKIIQPLERLSIPFSTLILTENFVQDFFADSRFSSETEFSFTNRNAVMFLGVGRPKVIVQSNIKSAFEN